MYNIKRLPDELIYKNIYIKKKWKSLLLVSTESAIYSIVKKDVSNVYCIWLEADGFCAAAFQCLMLEYQSRQDFSLYILIRHICGIKNRSGNFYMENYENRQVYTVWNYG